METNNYLINIFLQTIFKHYIYKLDLSH